VVRGALSPARAWRPAVVSRLPRTLGIRNTVVQYSSRKCAIRREPKTTTRPSREYSGAMTFHLNAAESPAVAKNLSSVPASVSTSQLKLSSTPHEAARVRAARSHQRRDGCSKDSSWVSRRDWLQRTKTRRQGCGSRRKAQSAMQIRCHSPQTRGTATALGLALALALARSGQHNLWLANSVLLASQPH
jgi:hypothetical protein